MSLISHLSVLLKNKESLQELRILNSNSEEYELVLELDLGKVVSFELIDSEIILATYQNGEIRLDISQNEFKKILKENKR